MPNDSSTGGYLSPSGSAPVDDDAFDKFLQSVVVGIVGLDINLVRPRWQPNPPKQPEPNINWCAIGIVSEDKDAFAAIIHHADGEGSDELQRHETNEVLASFYGPAGRSNASLFADGMQIAQNREALFLANVAHIEAGSIRAVPELVNLQWVKRHDLTWRIRRQINRIYPVLNLLSAQGSIASPTSSQNFDTENASHG